MEATSDRILGYTAFGVGAGEIMSAVQMAMIAGQPYTALRDAVLTHPTLVEGLIPLFSSVPSVHGVVGCNLNDRGVTALLKDSIPGGGVMGLSWQQGPLSAGAIGRFLVPEPMPDGCRTRHSNIVWCIFPVPV